MKPHPSLVRIWKVREKISAEHGNDLHRIFQHFMNLQEDHKSRVRKPSPKTVKRHRAVK